MKSWKSKALEVFLQATVPRVTFQKARVSSAVFFHGKITVQILHSIPFEGHLVRSCKNIIIFFAHFHFPALQKSAYSHLVGGFSLFLGVFSQFSPFSCNWCLSKTGRPVTCSSKANCSTRSCEVPAVLPAVPETKERVAVWCCGRTAGHDVSVFCRTRNVLGSKLPLFSYGRGFSINGGMTIPNVRSLNHGTNVDKNTAKVWTERKKMEHVLQIPSYFDQEIVCIV